MKTTMAQDNNPNPYAFTNIAWWAVKQMAFAKLATKSNKVDLQNKQGLFKTSFSFEAALGHATVGKALGL